MVKQGICLGALVLIILSVSQAMALTADQVLALKKAGVSERTIQLMIQQEMTARQNTESDAGMREIKDKDGNAVTVYSTGASSDPIDATERENVDRAWDMLHRVIIDGRK